MGSQSLFRGPLVNAGALQNATTQGEVVTPFDGPSIDYQGGVIPDVRQSPINSEALIPGSVPSFYGSPLLITYDGIPQVSAVNAIATAQALTAGNNLTLNTVVATVALSDGAQHLTYGLPIVPQGTSTPVIVSAIDFGFTTGTATANSSSLVVPDTAPFKVGQWIAVGGVGNTSSNTALITQVTGVTNRTTITISPVAATGRTRAPVGNAAFFGQGLTPETNPYVPAVVPNAATGQYAAGYAAVFDPRYGAGRGLVMNGGTGATVLVTGYDVHGNLMTEFFTGQAGGTASLGNKAFKYVRSIAAVAGTGQSASIGITDTFGFAWRVDSRSLTYVRNQTGVLASTLMAAVTLATTISPSTNTSNDVRGTINIATANLGTTNGTMRITIAQFASPDQIINASPLGYTSFFGIPQA